MPLSVRIIYLQTAVQSLPQCVVQMNLVIHYLTPQTYYHYYQQEHTRSISRNDKNIQTHKY